MPGDIAIIGLSLRFPGCDSLDGLCDHMIAERSLITEVSPDRWSARDYLGDPRKEPNKTRSIWGGFIENADCFDASFFKISPREAASMDPQQRIALELAWNVMEDAGYRPSSLAGSRIGVFMGVCHWDYAELLEKEDAAIDGYHSTGTAYSIISNRISWFFDFRGPSVSNDTACASSLVAIHDAVRALERGDCDCALAGGVNLCWSPNHFVAFSKNGMLSAKGKGRAFDAQADGYVRGEGGAVLLLKPLSKALEAGDLIYGVIKGVATAHGGRTSSLTVTSPTAQAELIRNLYEKAGIDPASVSYIEAHGPGTQVGDPIEILGLQKAFADLAIRLGTPLAESSCGVGSAKTNIGHLEGAAGIAGIAKVLGAFRRRVLPRTLHFERLNPLINLKGSPFYIVDKTEAWTPISGVRRAGVSAFGFGGTNAHIVIEEFQELAMESSGAPEIVPLSAADPDRLSERVGSLQQFLQNSLARAERVSLKRIAYTLQMGREELAARAVFSTTSVEDLISQLGDFHLGNSANAQLPEFAKDWLDGGSANWSALHKPPFPQRMSLPGYPFARQRHWFKSGMSPKEKREEPSAVLHPLLHKNTSMPGKCSFSSTFDGHEPFLKQHQINGDRVMPGVAFLEMVGRAIQETAPGESFEINDLVWSERLVVRDQPVTAEVHLKEGANGQRAFEIFSSIGHAPDLVYCRGYVRCGLSAPRPMLDLELLRTQCSILDSPKKLYEWLRASGVHHGPEFQGIESIYRGSTGLLARIVLPTIPAEGTIRYRLPPAVLDAALQAAVALLISQPGMAERGPFLPFALDSARVFESCLSEIWVWVTPSAASPGPGKFDLDLCDSGGKVCVEFRGCTFRSAWKESSSHNRLLFFKSFWKSEPPAIAAQTPNLSCFVAKSLAADLQGLQSADFTVEYLPDFDVQQIAQTVLAAFEFMFRRVRQILQENSSTARIILIAVPDTEDRYLFAPLAALLKTAALENPRISGKLLYLPLTIGAALDLRHCFETERGDQSGAVEVRYTTDGKRLIKALVEQTDEDNSDSPDPVARRGGVYWLTGGLGGLGRVFAEHLARTAGAIVILSGRAPLDNKEKILAGLRQFGATVEYVQVDIGVRKEVVAAVSSLLERYGRIDGILHLAGVVQDSFILRKDISTIQPVFTPKVAGAIHLDYATRDLSLEFMVFFSSIAGVHGNVGQADYAGANAFLDAFAEHRQSLTDSGLRRGKTVAIAWPLWKDGGMQLNTVYIEAQRKQRGLDPLPVQAGLEAFEQILSPANPVSCISVNWGAPAKIRAMMDPSLRLAAENPAGAGIVRSQNLRTAVILFLKKSLGEAIHLSPDKINETRKLEEYGLDSLITVELTSRLEETFGPLSKTLFFEHVDLRSVAGYIVDNHADAGRKLLPSDDVSSESIASAPMPAPLPELPGSFPESTTSRDVAVIGISGRYPGAETLDEFWALLRDGKDSFEEIPAERWDNDAIYSPRREILGKTVIRNGTFLKDIDKFDPRYFHISQRDAELMSPEVRLFLQLGVQALEDAGYSREYLQRKCAGDVAVLAGTMSNHYNLYGFENNLMRGAAASGSYTGTLPNMLSYFYGFTGPSIFVDTMCSGSSTCIHQAVQMLRAGECRMAVAGGINLILHPYNLISSSQESFTTSTAEVIRSYGLGADGTILGEGAGIVVLKLLDAAVRDGDHIYAVIKGTALTNAGVRNGFTVPNPRLQALAIEKALDDAKVDARSISYLEGHGSGTVLGDPIEIKGLSLAYEKHTGERQFCPIGSVKSNIAHLLAAAGIAGFTKVLLQLAHRQIAPSLHAPDLNPAIPFSDTAFYVQRKLSNWEKPVLSGRIVPRRAGITSIGAGGMNSHIIVEEFSAEPMAPSPALRERLFLFSATSPGALIAQISRFEDFLTGTPEIDCDDLAYSLQVGRNALSCRLAIKAGGREDLVGFLRNLRSRRPMERLEERGFLFIPNADHQTPPEESDVEVALKAGDLSAIAGYWVRGAWVDWDLLYLVRKPRRLSLPAYTFEKVRCWYQSFPDAPSVLAPLSGQSKTAPNGTVIGSESETHMEIEAVLPRSGAKDDLLKMLREIAAGILKFTPDEIDARTHLSGFGFNSLTLAQLADQTNRRLNTALSPDIFYQIDSLDELAGHILNLQPAPQSETTRLEPLVSPESRPSRAKPKSDQQPPIAIIGLAGKFPGSNNLREFWNHLQSGRDLVSPFPFERFPANSAKRSSATFPPWAGSLEGFADFDASFFHISPREAELMEPQHRIVLETAWSALEDACYAPAQLPRNTAVFMGVSGNDYATLLAMNEVATDPYIATGNSHAMLANRISFLLDIHGPSQAIDTACSSSLVAINRGVQALLSNQCDLAIVGGVNLLLDLETSANAHGAGMLSPDGRCKPFSKEANGYVRGEGVGVLILKRLGEAEAEADPIWGVIAGSAENHGGRATSLTSPNVKAQTELVRKAMAGIDPASVSYIETHGTGTSLGDPAEINALKLAWSELRQSDPGIPFRPGKTGLGSLKSNIGHLEAASGVAGVIKVLLSMAHRQLPPSLHCSEVNPLVKLDDSPFYLVQDVREWEGREPRRAGVSSFGFGGSNVHVVLEEYAERRPVCGSGASPFLIVLSARSENRLKALAVSLRDFLAQARDICLEDVAYTLQTGREAMEERLGFVVHSVPELESRLSEFIAGQNSNCHRGRTRDAQTLDRFLEEDDLSELAAMWVRNGEFSRLVDAWVRGHSVHWMLLYTAHKPRRISLPTYPFLKERHWPFQQDNSETPRSNGDVNSANRLLGSIETDVQNGKKRAISALDRKPGDEVDSKDIEAIIRSLASEILKVSTIDDDNSFQHYGLDSISGMQLAVRLEKRLKRPVPPQSLLNFPTAPGLAAYLMAGAGN